MNPIVSETERAATGDTSMSACKLRLLRKLLPNPKPDAADCVPDQSDKPGKD